MEEELEWVGKSGVVSEEDMVAVDGIVRITGCGANVRIKFPAQMLYLTNSHVIGYTTVDAKKRQRASVGTHKQLQGR